ncbi:MAG: DNA gyrase C-terminal beta-propeller domain-containing protein, partial [Halobacteriaceae archaeon]
DDYVKRMPVDQFSPQNRGGKGIIGTDLKETDRVSSIFTANTHDYLLCFTNQGCVYRQKVYELPEMGRTSRGKSAVNLFELDDGEEITAVISMDAFDDDSYLCMATQKGYVKRTPVEAFENIQSTGIIATSLDDGDKLVDVEVTDGTKDLILSTYKGMAIRFDESEVRSMGRTARGVYGIDLTENDNVVAMAAVDDQSENALLTITDRGYGKRTAVDNYRRQSRNGKGLIDIKTEGRNGYVTATETVSPSDQLFVMSEQGQIIRTKISDISLVGRNTKGVNVMDLEDEDFVACISVFAPSKAD